ncbi:MAG: Ig-like domain-containing protein [Bacteroidota bacterium]
MKWSLRGCLGIIALVLLACGGPARAQYIWMDSNGDGIYTAADVMSTNGTPMTVDVWINTSHNKDGSPAICDTHGGPDGDLSTWNSYAMHINAVGGTATFSSFVNQMPSFVDGCVGVGVFFNTNNSTEMSACAATGTPTANGGANMKMFTMTVTGQTGTPTLQFVPMNSQDQNFTSFGTPCSGTDFDNTYKLGADFFDNDGITVWPGGNTAPILSAPGSVLGTEGQPITMTATASDPDFADILTISAVGQPASLTLTTTPTASPATATLSGTLGLNDQGTHSITWSVSDGHNPPVPATTVLSVTNLDQVPFVTAPPLLWVMANWPMTFTVTAGDPDGDAITSLTAAPLPSGATFTPNGTNTSGTFSWTPTNAQAGGHTVTFTASNVLSGSASTNIGVNTDRAPVVTAPASIAGTVGQIVIFGVSVSDPDGDPIASLTASPLPAGAIFSPTSSNTSATFDWTPTAAQVGTADITFTASNALSGSATTSIQVTGGGGFFAIDLTTAGASIIGSDGVTWKQPVGPVGGDVIYDPFLRLQNSGSEEGMNTDGNAGATYNDVAAIYTHGLTMGQLGTVIEGGNTYYSLVLDINELDTAGQNYLSLDRLQIFTLAGSATLTSVPAVLSAGGVLRYDMDGVIDQSALMDYNIPTGSHIQVLVPTSYFAGASFTDQVYVYCQLGTVTGMSNNYASDDGYEQWYVLEGSAPPADSPPVVTAPATMTADEGTPITFGVTASDPDGDAIMSFTAAPLPAGATFTADSTRTFGTFSWVPSFFQSGSYPITFTASNALSGSAPTTITVNDVNQAPQVTAPATVAASVMEHIVFTVTASDPDHEEIGSLTAAPLPPGAIFTPGLGFTSGTFDWTPTLGMEGTHPVTFTASNALSGSATTTIDVVGPPPSQPPVVTAPDLVSVEELGTLSFTVTASDPDGTIASLVANLSGLPIGNDATFTTSPDNTSGTLVWHPATGMAGIDSVTFTAEDNSSLMASATTAIQVIAIGAEVVGTFDWTPAPPDTGSFTVTFTAIDSTGESGTASTDITVLPGTAGSRIILATPGVRLQTERGPIISCVSTASTNTGKDLSFTVSAYPDLSSPPQARTGTQAPATPAGTTRGPIISLTANLTALPTTNPATFTVDQDPLLVCPASVDAQPLFLVTFTVTASDPDGEPILTLTADRSMLPPGSLSTFTTNATNTSGTFAWTPQPQDVNAQPYPVVFTASNALYATGTTWITVVLGDRSPTAEAGGPYSGYPGASVAFDGTASSDPDGDALTYSWAFGDGATAVGATSSHAYTLAGDYTATLTVQEIRSNPLSARDNAAVTIGPLGVRAFVWGGNKTIRLRSGKPSFCAQLEPLNGSFQAADIDLGSIVMRYTSGGTTSEIHATTDKAATLRDLDGNGVLEVSACFAKTDLVRLFSSVVGRVTVTVDIAGRLATTGATFSVPLTVEVVGSTGTLAASVAPNPFNPSTTLSFETPHGGPVDLLVFDLAGRLVRDVTHRAYYAPGIYDIHIDALDEGGHRLASGVYFYRLATREGSVTGRLVLMQ